MLKPAPRRLVKLRSICEGVRFEREVTVIEHDGHYADEEFAAGESRLITMYSSRGSCYLPSLNLNLHNISLYHYTNGSERSTRISYCYVQFS